MTVHSAILPTARTLSWLGFYGGVLLAWGLVFQMARGTGGWLCGPDQVVLLPMGGFFALLPMWMIMMAAMMMPTIVPTLRAYDDLPVAAGAGQGGWLALIAGYCAVWLIGAAGFAGLQVLALDLALIDLTGATQSWWVAAALFGVAGAWQFSRTKGVCQDACQSPMQYFMASWKPGITGGWRMGVEIGMVCVGCCWAIMALGFVGGVSSLWWMGLATAFMVFEKLPDIGHLIRRPAGFALIGVALFCAIRAAGWV